MGAGLALQFKRRFPKNFDAYALACRTGEVAPGKLLVFDTGMAAPQYIINFPTKRHWRDPSALNDIEMGMVALRDALDHYGIRSVSIPALGAGLGGLPWEPVQQCIESALSDTPDVSIQVFAPQGFTAKPRPPFAP